MIMTSWRRRAAGAVLGLLVAGAAAAKPAAKQLLRQLPVAQGEAQLRVIRALGFSGNNEAVAGLLALFNVRQDSPRRSAVIAQALGRLGDRRAAEPLLGAWDYLVSQRQAMDLTAQVQVLRLAVLEALGRVGGEASGRALLEAVSDSDPAVVEQAARALGTMRERKAVDALASLSERGGSIGQAACEALGEIGDVKGRPALERFLQRENPSERIPAAYGLALQGRKDAVQVLEGFLGPSSAGEAPARLAAYYLIKLDRKSGLEFLMQALGTAGSPLQVPAAETLGRSGSARAVPPLVGALAAADVPLRLLIARSLGQIGGARAIAALEKLKGDSNLNVRNAASAALAESGGN